MAVCPGLCWSSVTLSSTARKRMGWGGLGGVEKEGKKQLTVKNKLDTLRFPSFLLFTIEDFLYGNSKRFQQLSTAQPVVWESTQAFHMYEVWQQGKQPPT